MGTKTSTVRLIAITGSIGSGKSLFSGIVKKRGYEVVSADEIAHRLLENRQISGEIVETFGKEVLNDEQIDRGVLGRIVFSDPEKLETLNSILHPAIIDELSRQIAAIRTGNSEKKGLVFFEIPLLYEAGIEKMFDLSINIYASEKLRIARLSARDNLTLEQISGRIKSQLGDQVKKERADITINNECSVECFEKTVGTVLSTLEVGAIRELPLHGRNFRGNS